jgi:2-keto-4-pentenoate hydratase/2-oxohepta-3-ene-1,7-dioic acid hydratase in catechol pathway
MQRDFRHGLLGFGIMPTRCIAARATVAVIAALLATASPDSPALAAQAPSTVAFKLGMFRLGARTFAGAVLEDSTVIDLASARPMLPRDVTQLIATWSRSRQLVVDVVALVFGAAKGNRPAYVHDLAAVTVLPPVTPRVILNATLNYQEHADELAKNPGAVAGVSATDVAGLRKPVASIPGLWTRPDGDTRHNPYFFIKPTTAVIAHGEAIRIPPDRDQIDAECELTVVIGSTASRVTADKAGDAIFGFTIENDVSDRRGRQDDRHGSDWLVAKGFDTFAPIGPFIVPKEFVPDPQALAVTLKHNETLMTSSNTSKMTHTVKELVSFASHVVTLQPGDLIDTGSPAGVGATRQLFLRPGDVSTCTVEGVGTLRNPVK